MPDDRPLTAGAISQLVVALLQRCTFPPSGTSVSCAVSGGADSLSLLVLAVEAGCDVTAIHVDHGLRQGSESEADVVAAAAERFGAAFVAERVDVEAGPNLEARARAARHAVLPDDAMLGHTADDQAETVLLNMMRGAGVDGLAAMRSGFRRPILGLRRTETEDLCAAMGLLPVMDPSNSDPGFRRNRVRGELLPLLCDIAERDVVPVLVRQASTMREVADYLAETAAHLDPTDTAALRSAPPLLARVALRQWLRTSSDDHHPPSASTLERVMAVVRGETVATELGRGVRVARTAGRLRLDGMQPSSVPE